MNSKSCNLCKNGYIYSIENGEETVQRCKCKSKDLTEAKLNIAYDLAGIPYNYFNSKDFSYYSGDKSKDKVNELKHFVDNFEELKFASFYLHGLPSTQKTTIAKIVGSELIKKGYSVKYMIMNTLIKEIINSDFEREGNRFNVDFLILDEAFDPIKMTVYKSNFQIPFLDTFIRERVETLKKSTMFISNVPLENVEYDYIREVVRRNCLIYEFKDKITKQDAFSIYDLIGK